VKNSNLFRLLVVGLGAVGLFAALFWTTGGFQASTPRGLLTDVARTPSATPTATPTRPTEAALVQPTQSKSTPVPAIRFPALPELTPPAEGAVHTIACAADAAGWVRQGDEVPNHLGDYNVYAGVFDGQAHIGLIQFDLSEVPPGAAVLYADLALVGLSDEWLGEGGAWQVEMLEPWLSASWGQLSYAELSGSQGAAIEVGDELSTDELAVGEANLLVFGGEARAQLEDQILSGRSSFRILGPTSGADNLFAWDSGYGARSQGWVPVLRIVTGPAPDTPPPTSTPYYVIITSMPAAENVVTAAVAASTATAHAQLYGTATPLPPHWVTPIVVTATPTPGNVATAEWQAAVATAQALLYGTPTPQPPNVWTATPPPTRQIVVVTNTPTPASWVEAVARAEAEATRRATAGPPTPFPPNVVTATSGPAPLTGSYVLVTSTPTPANLATAAARSAQATIAALTTGTYTPVPPSWATATPLPLVIPVERLTPTVTPTATPLPRPTPATLRGRILFQSDRLGEPQLFVMDPDGGNVGLLTQRYPYDDARQAMATAPDGVRRVVVQPDGQGRPQLYLIDSRYSLTRAITSLDGSAYHPAWAPTGDMIAFVSTEPGNDEVYTIGADGSGLRRLTWNTWEWDKHPFWSPDGRQIVFYSNRFTGRMQIWIMNADGSDQRNISDNAYNDWDPVWLK
jgi:hypothetical protein